MKLNFEIFFFLNTVILAQRIDFSIQNNLQLDSSTFNNKMYARRTSIFPEQEYDPLAVLV